MKRVIIYCRQTIPHAEHLSSLRQMFEGRGDVVVATFVDDSRITGSGKYVGWNKMVSKLDEADQVVITNVSDLPGRKIADLLKILAIVRDHGVTLYIYDLRVDTGGGNFDMLDVIKDYRAAKLSAAIRIGQGRAPAAGNKEKPRSSYCRHRKQDENTPNRLGLYAGNGGTAGTS